MAETVNIRLVADASRYVSEIRKAAGETDQLSTAAGRASGGIRGAFDRIPPAARAAFAGAGVAAAGFAFDAINSASDLEESVNAVQKTFGDASDEVLAFSKSAASSAGLAAAEFNSLATNTGSLLTNFGFTSRAAAEETQKLTVRAADLASVFNTSVPDALGAANAALRGETEPIRRYGISLDDASIRAKAVALGLADTTAEVDRNGRAVAALELIYEQSSAAAGDFAETQGGLANQTKIAAAEFENFKAEAGAALLPLAADTIQAGRQGLNALTSGFQLLSAAVTGNREAFEQADLERLIQQLQIETGGFVGNEGAALVSLLGRLGDDYISNADDLQRLADGVGLTADQARNLVDNFDVVAATLELSGDETETFRALLEDLARQFNTTANQEANAFEQRLAGIGNASSDAANDIDVLAGSIDDLQKAQRAATDPVFRLQQATQQYNDARQRLTELEADSSATTAELDDASGRLLQTQQDLNFALQDFEATGGEGISILDDLRRQAGLSRERFVALLESIGITGEALAALEGTYEIEVQIETVLTGASTDIDPSIIAATRRINPLAEIGTRAHGGPVNPYEPFLVGENGPELFQPATSGTIIPNNQITQNSGPQIVINNPQPDRTLDLDIQRGLLLGGVVRQIEVN